MEKDGKEIIITNAHLNMFDHDIDRAIKNLELGSIKDSYMLSIIMAEVRAKAAIFAEARAKLVRKYAKKGPDGNPEINLATQTVQIENAQRYSHEMMELLDIEVALNPLKIEVDLDKLGGDRCSVKVWDFLLPFVTVK